MAYAPTPPHFAQLGFGGGQIEYIGRVVESNVVEKGIVASTYGTELARVILADGPDAQANTAKMFAKQRTNLRASVTTSTSPDGRVMVDQALTGILLFSAAKSVLCCTSVRLSQQQLYNTYYYAALGQQCLTNVLYNVPQTSGVILQSSPNLYNQNPNTAQMQWLRFFRGALAASIVARCFTNRGGTCYLPETYEDQILATDLIYIENGRGYVVQVKTGACPAVTVIDTAFVRRITGNDRARRQANALLWHGRRMHPPFTPLHVVAMVDQDSPTRTQRATKDLAEEITKVLGPPPL